MVNWDTPCPGLFLSMLKEAVPLETTALSDPLFIPLVWVSKYTCLPSWPGSLHWTDIFKTPFLLYFDGYKYNEIAEALNEPLGTIKSRIHFARKLLKEQVSRY